MNSSFPVDDLFNRLGLLFVPGGTLTLTFVLAPLRFENVARDIQDKDNSQNRFGASFSSNEEVLCQGKVVGNFLNRASKTRNVTPPRVKLLLHMILLGDLMERYGLGFVYLK